MSNRSSVASVWQLLVSGSGLILVPRRRLHIADHAIGQPERGTTQECMGRGLKQQVWCLSVSNSGFRSKGSECEQMQAHTGVAPIQGVRDVI